MFDFESETDPTLFSRTDPDDDDGRHAFLKDLVQGNYIEESALGVAKAVLGGKTLSPRQLYVFRNYTLKPFITESCERCGLPVPWSEMLHAYEHGGLCSYCVHMATKDD